jgi:alpha-glucosidase
LYQDDGKTLAYKRGSFLRMEFACDVTPSSLTLHIGERQGSFLPWWDEMRVEVYGWDSTTASLRQKGKSPVALTVQSAPHVLSVQIPGETEDSDLEFLRANPSSPSLH